MLPPGEQLLQGFERPRERLGTGDQPDTSGYATSARQPHDAFSADAGAGTQSTRTLTTQESQGMRDQYGIVTFDARQFRVPRFAQSREEVQALPVEDQLRGLQGHRESITTAGGRKRKHPGDQSDNFGDLELRSPRPMEEVDAFLEYWTRRRDSIGTGTYTQQAHEAAVAQAQRELSPDDALRHVILDCLRTKQARQEQ